MHELTARDALELWEVGERQHPIDRALTLLAAAGPERGRDTLADLPLGVRDARLLALYEHLFGTEMVGFVRCPECGEEMELPLSVPELRRGIGAAVDATAELAADGVELRLRPLTSRDLAAAALAPDNARARRLLAERAVVEARREGAPIDPRDVPEALVERLAERLALCDPGAEILLDIDCPACEHHGSRLLDVGRFLWARFRGLAQRLLGEVAVLARGYAWSEAEILAMSPTRRREYLEILP